MKYKPFVALQRVLPLLLFGQPSTDWKQKPVAWHRGVIVDWSLEHQAFEKAEEFGVLYLKAFLRSLGFTDVQIEVQNGGK